MRGRWSSCGRRPLLRAPVVPPGQRSPISDAPWASVPRTAPGRPCYWLGTAEALSGDMAALDHLSEALHVAPDETSRATASLVMSQVLFLTGRLTEAAEVVQQSLERLGSDQPDLQAMLLLSVINAARINYRQDLVADWLPRLSRLGAAEGLARDLSLAQRAAEVQMHGESAAVAGQLAAAALASGRLREFRAGWDPVT